MFPVVSVERFDLVKRINVPQRLPSLTLWTQDIEIHMQKVWVRPIVPNSRIPSERSRMDQNEIHTRHEERKQVIAETC